MAEDKAFETALALIIGREVGKAIKEITVTIPPIEIPGLEIPTEPLLLYVTVTNANEEYEKALPDGTKMIYAQTSDASAFRVAWEKGHVGPSLQPYLSVPTNGWYYADDIKATGKTLYFACPTAGKTIEIEVWT